MEIVRKVPLNDISGKQQTIFLDDSEKKNRGRSDHNVLSSQNSTNKTSTGIRSAAAAAKVSPVKAGQIKRKENDRRERVGNGSGAQAHGPVGKKVKGDSKQPRIRPLNSTIKSNASYGGRENSTHYDNDDDCDSDNSSDGDGDDIRSVRETVESNVKGKGKGEGNNASRSVHRHSAASNILPRGRNSGSGSDSDSDSDICSRENSSRHSCRNGSSVLYLATSTICKKKNNATLRTSNSSSSSRVKATATVQSRPLSMPPESKSKSKSILKTITVDTRTSTSRCVDTTRSSKSKPGKIASTDSINSVTLNKKKLKTRIAVRAGSEDPIQTKKSIQTGSDAVKGNGGKEKRSEKRGEAGKGRETAIGRGAKCEGTGCASDFHRICLGMHLSDYKADKNYFPSSYHSNGQEYGFDEYDKNKGNGDEGNSAEDSDYDTDEPVFVQKVEHRTVFNLDDDDYFYDYEDDKTKIEFERDASPEKVTAQHISTDDDDDDDEGEGERERNGERGREKEIAVIQQNDTLRGNLHEVSVDVENDYDEGGGGGECDSKSTSGSDKKWKDSLQRLKAEEGEYDDDDDDDCIVSVHSSCCDDDHDYSCDHSDVGVDDNLHSVHSSDDFAHQHTPHTHCPVEHAHHTESSRKLLSHDMKMPECRYDDYNDDDDYYNDEMNQNNDQNNDKNFNNDNDDGAVEEVGRVEVEVAQKYPSSLTRRIKGNKMVADVEDEVRDGSVKECEGLPLPPSILSLRCQENKSKRIYIDISDSESVTDQIERIDSNVKNMNPEMLAIISKKEKEKKKSASKSKKQSVSLKDDTSFAKVILKNIPSPDAAPFCALYEGIHRLYLDEEMESIRYFAGHVLDRYGTVGVLSSLPLPSVISTTPTIKMFFDLIVAFTRL